MMSNAAACDAYAPQGRKSSARIVYHAPEKVVVAIRPEGEHIEVALLIKVLVALMCRRRRREIATNEVAMALHILLCSRNPSVRSETQPAPQRHQNVEPTDRSLHLQFDTDAAVQVKTAAAKTLPGPSVP